MKIHEKGNQILEIFGKTRPGLTKLAEEKLLAFGEGMAFMVDQRKGDAYKSAERLSA